jgi:hypothetical protein
MHAPPHPALQRPRRAGPGLLALAAVLAMHGWLLGGLAPPPRPAAAAVARGLPPLQLTPRPAPLVRPGAVPVVAAAVAKPVRAIAVERPAQRGAQRIADATPRAALRAPAVVADAAPAPVAQLPDAAELPVYPTRLPASASLYFELQRGTHSGVAELHWTRQGDDYTLSLEGVLEGSVVLGATSRGSIDANGVAPLRHAYRRRARELRAANFRRDVGLISFSGPGVEYALLPGAQDRLSWMPQLAAIFEADPGLARVALFVVGTRGDARAWFFERRPDQALDLPAGRLDNTVHLLRQPNHPYDTRVEVWLDPSRQHLPVRAVFTTVPGGQPLLMQLARSILIQ